MLTPTSSVHASQAVTASQIDSRHRSNTGGNTSSQQPPARTFEGLMSLESSGPKVKPRLTPPTKAARMQAARAQLNSFPGPVVKPIPISQPQSASFAENNIIMTSTTNMQQQQNGRMQKMSEQLAAQGQAIAQIKAKDASYKDHGTPEIFKAVQDMNATVQNMSEQLASQSEVIEQVKADNAALHSKNASLENIIETLSEMLKFHRTTSSAQQGHLDALNDVVRTRLGNIDGIISTLTERVCAAESAMSVQKTTTEDQFTAVREDVKKNTEAIPDLWSEKAALACDLESLERRIKSRVTTVEDKLNADFNSSMSRFAEVQGELDSDMNEIITLRQQQQNTHLEITEHIKSTTRLTTTTDVLQSKVQVLEGEAEVLTQRFAPIALMDEVASVKGRLQDTNDVAEELNKEIKAAREQDIAKVKKDVVDLKLDVNNTAQNLQDLEYATQTSAKSWKIDVEDINSKLERIDDLEEEMDNAKGNLTKLKQKIEATKNEGIAGIKEYITDLAAHIKYLKAPECTDALKTGNDNNKSKLERIDRGIDEETQDTFLYRKHTSSPNQEQNELQELQEQKDNKLIKNLDVSSEAVLNNSVSAVIELEGYTYPYLLHAREKRSTKAAPSITFDFGDDTMIDPNGDDFGPLGRNGDGEYCESFESEDARCSKCGNEHDEAEEWKICKACRGDTHDTVFETSDLI